MRGQKNGGHEFMLEYQPVIFGSGRLADGGIVPLINIKDGGCKAYKKTLSSEKFFKRVA